MSEQPPYEYQAWPCWCDGPNGERAVFESKKDVPTGWTHHDVPVAAEGKEELAGLRAHYKKVTGKKPFGGWNADTLRQKLDEAEGR